MMEERSQGVETRKPHDRVAKPRVDRREDRAHVVRLAEQRLNFDPGEERQGVTFKPCTRNGGQRKGEQQQIQPPLNSRCSHNHPAGDGRSFGASGDRPPQ